MFDYSEIPEGFYDNILYLKNGMRKFWHWHKFDSVERTISYDGVNSLLDIGCFSGSFLGCFFKSHPNLHKIGLDILPKQIEYANRNYQDEKTNFRATDSIIDISTSLGDDTSFDVVTIIEVIEHLSDKEIFNLLKTLKQITHKGSQIIITTPNYLSFWPLLEIALNLVSDVKYKEQHITKFCYHNFENKFESIYPNFKEEFKVTLKTTSHLLTPFISIFNYPLAKKISKSITPTKWKSPLGPMIILRLEII